MIATAARLDESRRTGVAIYTGNAHGWQDDNFVRADRIELFQNDKRMIATGRVESALYNMKRENGGKSEMVPCFVNANKMTYSDGERMIRYEIGVKALQVDDRIEASTIEVYLEKESSGVNKMIADGDVVMTQPGRKAVGDHLVYTAADENAVLTGKNARVDDKEKGTIMGSQLTFNKRDDKISVENQRGAGRVRSTHRLISNRESR